MCPSGGSAATCSATSGPQTAALLELFTSEGCNSCPPVDQWVSGLAAAGFGADKLVPLAFHVDYWDYIGWKDRFATAGFTQRQRDYSRTGGVGFVYTPQLLLNGSDFRSGLSYGRLENATRAINRQAARASIRLTLDVGQEAAAGALNVSASVRLADASQPVAVYLAVYENHLSSDVKAGENRGVVLHHEYVVRDWIGPLAVDADGKLELQRSLRLMPGQKLAESGLAAIVQNRRSGDVLQALQLPVCGVQRTGDRGQRTEG